MENKFNELEKKIEIQNEESKKRAARSKKQTKEQMDKVVGLMEKILAKID